MNILNLAGMRTDSIYCKVENTVGHTIHTQLYCTLLIRRGRCSHNVTWRSINAFCELHRFFLQYVYLTDSIWGEALS